MNAYAQFERVTARAARAPDPVASLARAARDRRLPAECRAWLRAIDPVGFRMSALLIAQLRFQRLLNGSPAAAEWFERDGAEFTAAFRRYHADVAPTGFFPVAEAHLFARWLRSRASPARAARSGSRP